MFLQFENLKSFILAHPAYTELWVRLPPETTMRDNGLRHLLHGRIFSPYLKERGRTRALAIVVALGKMWQVDIGI